MTSYQDFVEAARSYKTVPVVGEFFADAITPIQIVQQVNEQVSFILESKDDESPWSRYSFIGLNPMIELIEELGMYKAVDRSGRVIVKQDSFQKAFDQTLEALQVQPVELPIPFRGGAVGYMAYDAIDTIEPSLAVEGKKHLDPLYHFLFCQTMITYDHTQKQLTITHFSETQEKGKIEDRYQEAVQIIQALVDRLDQPGRAGRLGTPPQLEGPVSFEGVRSNYEKDAFLKDVEKIKEYIRAGDVFQAVLSQRFEMDVTVSALDLYRVLRMINPSPYLFYLKFDNKEVVGSSPERLVQVENRHVEIHPIAGTRKRGETPEEDDALAEELLADEKERAEHYMLVDLARNDVGRVATYGSVKTPALLEIGKFSHVMHIISKVTGELREGLHPLEALHRSFPAGTVSGAPKIRAMEILKELEPTKRGLYAGAIGYLGYDGNIDSCIAIRTMVVQDGKVFIQAGAGIVADSVPENEYEETRNKAKALLKAVQVAEAMFGEKEAKRHA
nr:anthranilate synthase component I [Halalkalibacterium ligniniphilum]